MQYRDFIHSTSLDPLSLQSQLGFAKILANAEQKPLLKNLPLLLEMITWWWCQYYTVTGVSLRHPHLAI